MGGLKIPSNDNISLNRISFGRKTKYFLAA